MHSLPFCFGIRRLDMLANPMLRKGAIGILPPEIAKLIHVYVFEDVLKELLEKTKGLLKNTELNSREKFNEHMDIHIFIDGAYKIKYNPFDLYFLGINKNKHKLIKRKIIFLKKHNEEKIISCICGKKYSISEYNEKDVWRDNEIRCIHKEKIENK